jgi:hypothetical protein
MRWAVLTLAAIALAAGCSKNPESSKAAPRTDAPASATTPTPSSGSGATASPAEKKDGANPVQGHVDPKAPEQTRDFKQQGDGAGPKPGG